MYTVAKETTIVSTTSKSGVRKEFVLAPLSLRDSNSGAGANVAGKSLFIFGVLVHS